MNNLLTLVRCLGTAFVPSLSGVAARPDRWYEKLEKSPLNSPPPVFPVVWTALYTMMGIAHYQYSVAETVREKSAGHRWYALQLLLNGTWSLVFFRQRAPWAALANLLLLLAAIASTVAQFKRVSKTSSRLLLPYFLWCCFATYLNLEICRRNTLSK